MSDTFRWKMKAMAISGFIADEHLHEEVFGPAALVVRAASVAQAVQVLQAVGGSLTGVTLSEAVRDRRFWTIWLSIALVALAGTVLFAVDHHRGSEENQAGWEHHDTTVVDPRTGKMDTLPFFRRALAAAGLEDERYPYSWLPTDAAPGEAGRPDVMTSRGLAGSIVGCSSWSSEPGSIRITASSLVISPSLARSTATFSAALAVRLPLRVWSM